MSRMTLAEERALWSRVSPEQWDAMTRIAVQIFTGKDPEPQKNTDPEPALAPGLDAAPARDDISNMGRLDGPITGSER